MLLELIFLQFVIILVMILYAKSTTKKLNKLKTKKSLASNEAPEEKQPNEKNSIPLESPVQFLQNELIKTKNIFLKRTNLKSVSYQKDLSKEDKILFVRATYLNAECSAIPQRLSSDKYFRVISSLLSPILNQMVKHNNDAEIKTKDNQIALLRERISGLKDVESENNALSFELAKSRNAIEKNIHAKAFDDYIRSSKKMAAIQKNKDTHFLEIKSSMTRTSESESSTDRDYLKSKLKKLELNLSKSENQIIELTKKLMLAKKNGTSTITINGDLEELKESNEYQKNMVDELESNIKSDQDKDAIEKLKATIKEFTGCVETLENEVDYLQGRLENSEHLPQECSISEKDYDILSIVAATLTAEDIIELSEIVKSGLDQIGVNSIFKIASSRDTIKVDSSGVFKTNEKSLLSTDNSTTESPHNVAEGVKLIHDSIFTLIVKYQNRDDEISLINELKLLHEMTSISVKNIDRKYSIIELSKKTKKVLEKTKGKLTDLEIKSAFHQEEIHKTYSQFSGEIKKSIDSDAEISKSSLEEALNSNQERIALLFSVGDVVERQYEAIGDDIRNHLEFIDRIEK